MFFPGPADNLGPGCASSGPNWLKFDSPVSMMGFMTFVWKLRNDFPNIVGRNQKPLGRVRGLAPSSHGHAPVLDALRSGDSGLDFISGQVSPWLVFTTCPHFISGFVLMGDMIRSFFKNDILSNHKSNKIVVDIGENMKNKVHYCLISP